MTTHIPEPVKRALRDPFLAIRWLRNQIEIRGADLDIDSFVETLAAITDSTPSEVRSLYYECVNGEPIRRYETRCSTSMYPYSTFRIKQRLVGPLKTARFDRVALYCLVRLAKPETVVETGVKWGESSFFILEALQANGTGELYSFDAGLEVASQLYPIPAVAREVGFLVNDQLSGRWNLIIGDSLEEMELLLPEVSSVDLFYHDSLHTYDHMLSEFELVLDFMADGGLLMSEDIHHNDAWGDFLAANADVLDGDHRYYSMEGFNTNREIGATTVNRP